MSISISTATDLPLNQNRAPGACPLCQGVSHRHLEVSSYWIRQCLVCRHQFLELATTEGHVERHYGDQYFTSGGAGYSDYLVEQRLLVNRGKWYARRIARHGRPGDMLDVGAAAGFTMVAFRDSGWKAVGVEPNPSMAEFARQQFHLDVEAAPFESWQTSQTFDLITMLQVLPHFVDPAAAIRKAAALLRPGGYLLIETWDRSSLSARLFGRGWHEYSPPSVLHWFSRSSLKSLALNAGFTHVATGRPSKWIDAEHAKSILRHKQSSSLANRVLLAASCIIPNRLALPYPFDDLFWALFQRRQPAPSL